MTLISSSDADFHHPIDIGDSSAESSVQLDSVWGVCYEVPVDKIADTLEYLDVREQGGYERTAIDVYSDPQQAEPILRNVLLYTATTQNKNYLGPAPLLDIAKQIAVSIGPSGPNTQYLFELHHTLVKNGIQDSHVVDLFNLVTALVQEKAAVAS